MKPLVITLVLIGCTAGAVAAAPSKQQAKDFQQCSDYGFQPGTDAFAHCMMEADQRRDDKKEADKARDAEMRALSIRRNGDSRFPVCSAAMISASLDTYNNAWYGPNCREQ